MIGKKIIITGGAGFFGKNVFNLLLSFGAKKENIFIPRSSEYDLRVRKDVERMFNDFPAGLVIHLAANTGGIEYYKKNPGRIFFDNISMGINIIDVSREKGVEKLG